MKAALLHAGHVQHFLRPRAPADTGQDRDVGQPSPTHTRHLWDVLWLRAAHRHKRRAHAAAGTAGTCSGAGALSRHTRKGCSLQTHLFHHCNHPYQLTCSRALVKAKPLMKGAPSPTWKVNQHVALLSGLQTNLSLYGKRAQIRSPDYQCKVILSVH